MQRDGLPYWFHVLVWPPVVVVLTLLGTYLWVDWKGARDLRLLAEEFERRHETLDFDKLVRGIESVPDEENFCATPALYGLRTRGMTDASAQVMRIRALELPMVLHKSDGNTELPSPAGAEIGEPTDLRVWADWAQLVSGMPHAAKTESPGKDLWEALPKDDDLIKELAQALTRPKAQWLPSWQALTNLDQKMSSRWPIYYSFNSVKLSTFLCLRTIAAGHAGDFPSAHESLRIQLRLAEALEKEPDTLSVDNNLVQITSAANATWELCLSHAGTEMDFLKLEKAWRQIDLDQSVLFTLKSTCALLVVQNREAKEEQASATKDLLPIGTSLEDIHAWLEQFHPDGWYDQQVVHQVKLLSERLIQPIQTEGFATFGTGGALSSALRKQPDAEAGEDMLGPNRLVLSHALHGSARIDQAIIACALEQYFLKHRRYPESLAELKGSLPNDFLSGKAMRYETTPNGRYKLWAVGFDLEDDGGKRILNTQSRKAAQYRLASYEGDWVWDLPGVPAK